MTRLLVDWRTVAYVPSPNFSNCWKELGCLLSMFAVGLIVDSWSLCTVIGGGGWWAKRTEPGLTMRRTTSADVLGALERAVRPADVFESVRNSCWARCRVCASESVELVAVALVAAGSRGLRDSAGSLIAVFDDVGVDEAAEELCEVRCGREAEDVWRMISGFDMVKKRLQPGP